MSRLTRIVCDNAACTSQVEQYADQYFRRYQGMDHTPQGWYKLTYHDPRDPDAGTIPDAEQPRFFCSLACIREFAGGIRQPVTTTFAPDTEDA